MRAVAHQPYQCIMCCDAQRLEGCCASTRRSSNCLFMVLYSLQLKRRGHAQYAQYDRSPRSPQKSNIKPSHIEVGIRAPSTNGQTRWSTYIAVATMVTFNLYHLPPIRRRANEGLKGECDSGRNMPMTALEGTDSPEKPWSSLSISSLLVGFNGQPPQKCPSMLSSRAQVGK
jgi:hypothetical protein